MHFECVFRESNSFSIGISRELRFFRRLISAESLLPFEFNRIIPVADIACSFRDMDGASSCNTKSWANLLCRGCFCSILMRGFLDGEH